MCHIIEFFEPRSKIARTLRRSTTKVSSILIENLQTTRTYQQKKNPRACGAWSLSLFLHAGLHLSSPLCLGLMLPLVSPHLCHQMLLTPIFLCTTTRPLPQTPVCGLPRRPTHVGQRGPPRRRTRVERHGPCLLRDLRLHLWPAHTESSLDVICTC